MSSITLKNIPEELHALYKRRAKEHSRSLQAEILATLADSAELPQEENLEIDEVMGILGSGQMSKAVSVEEMDRAVDKMFRETWER